MVSDKNVHWDSGILHNSDFSKATQFSSTRGWEAVPSAR